MLANCQNPLFLSQVFVGFFMSGLGLLAAFIELYPWAAGLGILPNISRFDKLTYHFTVGFHYITILNPFFKFPII